MKTCDRYLNSPPKQIPRVFQIIIRENKAKHPCMKEKRASITINASRWSALRGNKGMCYARERGQTAKQKVASLQEVKVMRPASPRDQRPPFSPQCCTLLNPLFAAEKLAGKEMKKNLFPTRLLLARGLAGRLCLVVYLLIYSFT